MGLLSQAPIGSLPARPARAWVNAARPVDRSMPGHEVVRSRGQIRPDSANIMTTVVTIATEPIEVRTPAARQRAPKATAVY